MSKLTDVQSLVLAKIGKKFEDADMAPGAESFDFTLRLKGGITRGEDTEKTPTSRALTLETVALMLHRMGFQRERVTDLLVEAMLDNLLRGESQKEALAEIPGVKEAKEKLAARLALLPKTPVKGQVRVKVEVVEVVEDGNTLPVEGRAKMPG